MTSSISWRWRKAILVLPLLTGLVFLFGCTSSKTGDATRSDSRPSPADSAESPSAQATERTLIATIGGNDPSIQHSVAMTLYGGGVRCDFSGSVGYGVFVSQDEAERAIELLRASPNLPKDRIEFVNLKKGGTEVERSVRK